VVFIDSEIRINIDWTLDDYRFRDSLIEWEYSPSKINTNHKVWEHFKPVIEGFEGEVYYDKTG
jgi:hypothetical protein